MTTTPTPADIVYEAGSLQRCEGAIMGEDKTPAGHFNSAEAAECAETIVRPRSTVPACVLTLAWVAALFALQEYTTASNHPLTLSKAIGVRAVRALIDLLGCGTLVLLLRGRLLYLVLVLSACGALLLTVCFEYFGRTLSLMTIKNHFSEGVAVAKFAAHLLWWRPVTLVLLATTVLLALARWANRTLPQHRCMRSIALFGAAYAGVGSVAILRTDRMLRTFGTVDRMAMTYGYLLTWCGEYRYLDETVLLGKANEAASIGSDRITPAERQLPLPPLTERANECAVAELRTNERQESGVELQEKGPHGVENALGPRQHLENAARSRTENPCVGGSSPLLPIRHRC